MHLAVTRQADGTFHVQTPAGTSHHVSVPAGFPARLGCSHVDPGELVRASFEFLLQREPAASILREFSLDILSQYFPGYPRKASSSSCMRWPRWTPAQWDAACRAG